MDRLDSLLASRLARRRLLALGSLAGGGAIAAAATPSTVRLMLAQGAEDRPIAADFAGKKAMIVQRNRPPLLETPMEVFDRGVFTPNDQFYVRWHWADIPLEVDAQKFRLEIGGHVRQALSLGLDELLRMPRLSYAAVNQCSGNSRAFFQPRVPGAQWAHGAMGNALWEGVSLRTVLDRVGIAPGATAVRFGGMDRPLTDVDPFDKSLSLDHARDGEVMIAFAMNGEQLPMLNGFPLRLVVPGWYSTYWVKALDRIEVLAAPDTNYWMAKAYQVPTAGDANVTPRSKDFPTAPISAMVPRSWITSVASGTSVPFRPHLPVRGIAMGGDCGVSRVELSIDGGQRWMDAALGPDEGRYGFRRFASTVPVPAPGPRTLLSRCTNSAGRTQQMTPNWNPGGYMRGCVEMTHVILV